MEPFGKPASGIKELSRPGSFLRTFFLQRKSSEFQYVKKVRQGRQETSMAQQGPPCQTKM